MEKCNDFAHQQLTTEVKELLDSIRSLENKLADSNGALADLVKNRDRLDQNMKVKKNSLLIDQQKCMSGRKHFPYVVNTMMRDPVMEAYSKFS